MRRNIFKYFSMRFNCFLRQGYDTDSQHLTGFLLWLSSSYTLKEMLIKLFYPYIPFCPYFLNFLKFVMLNMLKEEDRFLN